jgi:hypothetical protein
MFGENICIEVLDNDEFEDSYTNLELITDTNNCFDGDTFVAKQIDYKENYLLADLKKIADYYDISTRKLKKEELVQEIVLFETNPENSEIYFNRLDGWYKMINLKKDPKLKQYILF